MSKASFILICSTCFAGAYLTLAFANKEDTLNCYVIPQDDQVEIIYISQDELDNYKGDESLSIPQISYNLVFDNDQQQKVWYEFLKYLKNKYNDSDTHASRINKFIEENAVEED